MSPIFQGFIKDKVSGCKTPFDKCDVLAVEFFIAGQARPLHEALYSPELRSMRRLYALLKALHS